MCPLMFIWKNEKNNLIYYSSILSQDELIILLVHKILQTCQKEKV